MSEQYTPTWDRVREHYYLGRQQFDDPLFPAGGVTEIVAEFDRWYQAEIAAAEQRGAEQAWDEGRTAGNAYEADVQKWHRLRSSRFLDDMPEYPDKPRNPYRADRVQGGQE